MGDADHRNLHRAWQNMGDLCCRGATGALLLTTVVLLVWLSVAVATVLATPMSAPVVSGCAPQGWASADGCTAVFWCRCCLGFAPPALLLLRFADARLGQRVSRSAAT